MEIDQILRKYNLSTQIIPEKVKEEITNEIAALKSQSYFNQTVLDFESLISHLDSGIVIQQALNFFRERFEISKVAIALLEEDPPGFKVYAYAYSDEARIFKGRFIPQDRTFMTKVIQSGQPFYRPDIAREDDSYEMDELLHAAGVRSVFYIPLFYENKPLGTLNLSSQIINAFSGNLRDLIIQLARRLSFVLKNVLLHQQVQKNYNALETSRESYLVTLQALKESEAKYKMLVEKLDQGVCLEDPNGYFKFVNPKAAEILGYDVSELEGQHWTIIVSVEERAKVAAETEKRPQGIGSRYETSIIAKDGRIVPVIVTAAPIFGDDGKFEGVLTVFTDITDRKRVEEDLRASKEKYQMLIERMEEGVLLEDATGVISFVNPRTCEMLGYAEKEIIGLHWSQLIPSSELTKFQDESKKRVLGHSSVYEGTALRKDGSTFPVIISARPILRDDQVYEGVLSVFTDISVRIETEQQLKQLKLEEERYHQMVSHFTKNDLHKIINNLELLKMKYEEEEQLKHEIVTEIIQTCQHSAGTIDKVNRIFEVLQKSPQNTNQCHPLLDMVNSAISQLDSPSDMINVDISSLNGVSFYGQLIDDAILEVLMYSLRFRQDEEYRIQIEGSLSENAFSLIIREPWGPPIPENIIEKIVGKITDKWTSQGHYIGIALSSVILRLNSGDLKIKPLFPKGNEFTFVLKEPLLAV
ncbi:MAG: PAS domain S-box protein [Candidatus Thorarchaeota archaeon]